MSSIQLRPTFSIPTDDPPRQVMQRIRSAVTNHSAELTGMFTDEHATLSIAEAERHFWSPCLHLEIRKDSSGENVFGRFSPHSSIWTGFVFAYLSLSVLTFFSLVLGFSQRLASQNPWGFYLPLGWLLIAVTLWLVSKTGQKLAATEMRRMKEIVEDCLSESSQSLSTPREN